MKIVYYEMRKSWVKISTLIVLAILTVLNFIQAEGTCGTYYSKTYGKRGEAYFALYNTVCGEVSEEKIAPFRQRAKELENEVSDMVFSHEYNPDEYITGYIFGDFNLYNVDIAPEITYAATYPNISDKIAANAAECFHFYKSVGNDYEAEKYAMAYEMYQNRQIPEYRATYWTNLFFNHDFSSLLCVIMLILGLANSFTNERESGMLQIIGSSGKSKSTTLAKIASAAVYCLFLSVYFTAADLAAANIILGVDGLDMPLYSAKMLQNTPFSFSFAETILLWITVKFFALFVVALMILFVSKISPNTIISIVLSFGSALVLIFLTAVSKSIFNPFNIIAPTALAEEYSAVNIFGQPVLTLWAAIIISAVECAVLCAANTFIGQKSRR